MPLACPARRQAAATGIAILGEAHATVVAQMLTRTPLNLGAQQKSTKSPDISESPSWKTMWHRPLQCIQHVPLCATGNDFTANQAIIALQFFLFEQMLDIAHHTANISARSYGHRPCIWLLDTCACSLPVTEQYRVPGFGQALHICTGPAPSFRRKMT